jgi:hypothetical protein
MCHCDPLGSLENSSSFKTCFFLGGLLFFFTDPIQNLRLNSCASNLAGHLAPWASRWMDFRDVPVDWVAALGRPWAEVAGDGIKKWNEVPTDTSWNEDFMEWSTNFNGDGTLMGFGVQHQPWGFSQMILEVQQTVYDRNASNMGI